MNKNLNNGLAKGNELEEAVAAIEKVIFSDNPSLSQSAYTIETKKIVKINGVRNEVDLYVEFDLGNGKRVVEIFECKNWNKKVGKNEIIVFSSKIRSLEANKGYFVAKQFTRDAHNQAKAEGRIDIVPFNDNFQLTKLRLSGVVYDATIYEILFDGKKIGFNPDVLCNLGKHSLTVSELIDVFKDRVLKRLYKKLDNENLDNDKKIFDVSEKFTCIPPLTVGEYNFDEVLISVTVNIVELTPVIKSQFDIEKRGRHYKVDFTDSSGEVLNTIKFTQIKENELNVSVNTDKSTPFGLFVSVGKTEDDFLLTF